MKEKPCIRPYSKKELAFLYEMSTHCFNTMIEPFIDVIGKKKGWYFNVNQVNIIFEKAGYPNGLLHDEHIPDKNKAAIVH